MLTPGLGFKRPDTKLAGRVVTHFHRFGKASPNQVQVDVDCASRDGLLIDQRNGFEAIFEETALGLILVVAAPGDSLVKQTHPPGNIAQSQTDFSQLLIAVANGIKLFPARLARGAVLLFSMGTDHQPTPCHLGIVPRRNDIGTRSQHQVIVIGKDRKRKQVDPKLGREVPESFFNPSFAMVVIDASQRIVTEEPTAADGTVENVEHLNLGGINDLTTRLS